MKLGIIGCITGSAAALLLGGCAADRYAVADGYCGSYAQTTYVEDQPEFIEERTVFRDRQPHNVAVYRAGDTYFYTYAGARYPLADYPPVARTGYRAVRYSRYHRPVNRALVRTGYTEDESTAFRRTRAGTPVLTSPVVGSSVETPVIEERAVTPTETRRVTAHRVRVTDY